MKDNSKYLMAGCEVIIPPRVFLPVMSKTSVLFSARISPLVSTQSLINNITVLVIVTTSSVCSCITTIAMSYANRMMCMFLGPLSRSILSYIMFRSRGPSTDP